MKRKTALAGSSGRKTGANRRHFPLTRAALFSTVAVLATTSAGPPVAGQQASAGFAVHVSVPLICWVHTEPQFSAPLRAGSNDLGYTDEYCNVPNGYRLALRHDSLPVGAQLLVDGQPISLTPDKSETLVKDRNKVAYHKRRHLELVLTQAPRGNPGLALRIQPKE